MYPMYSLSDVTRTYADGQFKPTKLATVHLNIAHYFTKLLYKYTQRHSLVKGHAMSLSAPKYRESHFEYPELTKNNGETQFESLTAIFNN